MQPYNCTDTITAWKNSYFILSDVHIIINLSIAQSIPAYVYDDIAFSKWDIATKVSKPVY